MISTTAKYALRSVVFLASRENGFHNRATIAEATRIPPDYLLKVLKDLDAAGIVESRRGPGGGYRLLAKPDGFSVLDVVHAVDRSNRIHKCPLGISAHGGLCPLHRLLDEAAGAVESLFEKTLIADLVTEHRRGPICPFPHASLRR